MLEAALIGAGASLLGNLLNKGSQDSYNAQQMQLAQQNIQLQKDFAQHGIQWKVEDAKAAGLHPLAALGAQTSSFSPVSVGGEAPKMDFSSMGQDLSRAAKAMAGAQAREAVDEAQARKLGLEKASLENDILRAELASKVNTTGRASGQLGPPMPVATGLPAGWAAHLMSGSPNRTVGGVAVGEDDIKQKAEDFPATRIVRPFGYPLMTAPALSDGQSFEDRYGESELFSTAKAATNLIGDHVYTGYKMAEPYARAGYRAARRFSRDFQGALRRGGGY